ncbi:MAG: hypothetical protein AB7I08_02260 [Thermoleophilia bacterium]
MSTQNPTVGAAAPDGDDKTCRFTTAFLLILNRFVNICHGLMGEAITANLKGEAALKLAFRQLHQVQQMIVTAKLNLAVNPIPDAHHRLSKVWVWVISAVVAVTNYLLMYQVILGLGFTESEAYLLASALIALEVLAIAAIGTTMRNSIRKLNRTTLTLMVVGLVVAALATYPRWVFFDSGEWVPSPVMAAVFVSAVSLAVITYGVWVLAMADAVGSGMETTLKGLERREAQLVERVESLTRLVGQQRAALVGPINATTVEVMQKAADDDATRDAEPMDFESVRALVAERLGVPHALEEVNLVHED